MSRGRVKYHSIEPRERYEMIGDFYDIVTNLKDKKEVIQFFSGLYTPGESVMFARRIQVAKMIVEEKTYSEIQEKLGVGLGTVANVAKWLDQDTTHVRKQISAHQKRKPKGKKAQIQWYHRILNPYSQIKMIQDILNHRVF